MCRQTKIRYLLSQNKLKHRLSTIMDEVQLQEMLNEAVSEEIHNLKLLTGVLSLSPDGIELLNNWLSSQTNNHPIDAFTNPQHLPQLQVQSSSQQQRTLSNSQPMDKLRSIQELPQLQVQAPNHHQPQQLPQLQLPTSSQQQQSHREAPKQREKLSSGQQHLQIQLQVPNQQQQLHHQVPQQLGALSTMEQLPQLLVQTLNPQQCHYLAQVSSKDPHLCFNSIRFHNSIQEKANHTQYKCGKPQQQQHASSAISVTSDRRTSSPAKTTKMHVMRSKTDTKFILTLSK
ncbi:hypothetical protein CK203_091663 [Vitis vinifera]|uniref:Uncharacterized protein n=1 Tax=Vitis vinifera TaxID=29760 RepID=A0A438FB03_VITVI|nr:hypothetical protein CK203_091663 [Vitis vinifera]